MLDGTDWAMKHLLCLTATGVLFALATLAPATREFNYSLSYSHLAEGKTDPGAEARNILRLQRQDGMTKAEASQSLSGLEKAFGGLRDGFTMKGKTSICCGDWGSRVETTLPSLNGPKAGLILRESFDGAMTVRGMEMMPTSIETGEKRRTLCRVADMMVLGGYLDPNAKQIGANRGLDSYMEVYEKDKEGTIERVELTWAGPDKARLISAVSSYLYPSETVVNSTYRIRKWQKGKDGFVPSSIEISRYARKSIVAIEEYELQSIDEAPIKSMDSQIPTGSIVVDLRLGENRQSSYSYDGTIPSMSSLRTTKNVQESLAFVTTPAFLVISLGVAFIVVGALIQRRNSRRQLPV